MTRYLRTSFLAVAAAMSVAWAAQQIAIADIVQDPAKFDHKVVTVVGKAVKYKAKRSKKGNDYFNFRIQESADVWMSVYGQGTLEHVPAEGDRVQVTGEFARGKTVADVEYKNEIDVTKRSIEEKTKDFGVKILPK